MRFPAAIPYVVLSALSASSSGTAWSQVRIRIIPDPNTGPGIHYPAVNVCNEAPSTLRVEGWRFRTADSSAYTTWLPNLTREGSGPVVYTQKVPALEAVMSSGSCRIAPVDYTGTSRAGQDIAPFYPQALVKVGTCATPLPVQETASLTCSGLEGKVDYSNQCLASAPSDDPAGSFLATFGNRTQIQAGLPVEYSTHLGKEVKWDPRSLQGPQYMMALAGVQEFFHVDMKLLAAIAGREMLFGYVEKGKEAQGSVSEWSGWNFHHDFTFTPWEIEVGAFNRTMFLYPRFFPKYGPCLNKYPDVSPGVGSCPGSGEGAAAAFYTTTPGISGTGINSPQLASGAVAVALTWLAIYDALSNSTDLYFHQALAAKADPRVDLAALVPAYNLGPFTDFAEPFKNAAIVGDANASAKFAVGNSNHRIGLFNLLDGITAATSASTACGGAAGIYDAPLALSDVQRFFFGGSATPGTPAAQGDGGLLSHFEMTTAERQALWSELQCAFDRLKGKAPSTIGKESVSYRYDWLSLLRVAKARMPEAARIAPLHGDMKNVIDRYSANPIASTGKPIESAYPFVDVLSPALNAVMAPDDSGGFAVSFKARDSAGAVRGEWTLDRDWEIWNAAQPLADGGFRFRVACADKGYPAPGKPGSFWIRGVDGCGNATVTQWDFTAHPSAQCGAPTTLARPGKANQANEREAKKALRAKETRRGKVRFDGSRAGRLGMVDARGKAVDVPVQSGLGEGK